MKAKRCKGPKGLPILEIPEKGPIYERLSPGEIREADYFELFRKVSAGKGEILVACPKGSAKSGKCQEPMVLLRVTHPREKKAELVRKCDDGSLYLKRNRGIDRVLDVVSRKELAEYASSASLAQIIGILTLGLFGCGMVFRGGQRCSDQKT